MDMSLFAHLQFLSSTDPHCYYMEYESYDAMQASILFDAPPIQSLSTLLKTILWAKIQDDEDIALIPPNENNMSLLFFSWQGVLPDKRKCQRYQKMLVKILEARKQNTFPFKFMGHSDCEVCGRVVTEAAERARVRIRPRDIAWTSDSFICDLRLNSYPDYLKFL